MRLREVRKFAERETALRQSVVIPSLVVAAGGAPVVSTKGVTVEYGKLYVVTAFIDDITPPASGTRYAGPYLQGSGLISLGGSDTLTPDEPFDGGAFSLGFNESKPSYFRGSWLAHAIADDVLNFRIANGDAANAMTVLGVELSIHEL